MKKYIAILFIFPFLAACSRIESGDTGMEYVKITLDPQITAEVSAGPASKAAPELGLCDIQCFVYDADAGNWSGPIIQDKISGSLYTYIIPKMSNAVLQFAVCSGNVQYTLADGNPDITFSCEPAFQDGTYLYASDRHYYATDGEVSISATLEQKHYNLDIGLKFTNMPYLPEEFIRKWTFEAQSSDDNLYPLGQLLGLESMSQEADTETGEIYYRYRTSGICNSLYNIIFYFDTFYNKIYNCPQYVGDYKNFKGNFTIDYNNL